MIKKILHPALVATSAMTLFSYIIAAAAKKNFSEPRLLAQLEKKKFALSRQNSLPAGWATHYIIGILMVTLFNTTWKILM